MKLTVTGYYTAKDQKKADQAGKFIGRGSACGDYQPGDVVFISAEGKRSGRLPIDAGEIRQAAASGVTFVTDGPLDRERPYNVGEREVAALLRTLGYQERSPGRWIRSRGTGKKPASR